MARKTGRRPRTVSEEDELESAYRSISGYKGKYKKKTFAGSTPVIIAICIAIVAIIVGIAAGVRSFINADLNGVILENVSVAGVNVGGMTQLQAIDAVEAATSNTFSTSPMVVTVLDSQTQIPVKYVGKLDVRGAVKAAYKFGKSGSPNKQQQQQQIAMTEGYSVDLIPYLDINEEAIRQILSDLGANYSSTLRQSTYSVTGAAPSQTLIIELGVPEYQLDLNLLYEQVLTAYSKNIFSVTGQCGVIEPDPIDLDAIYEEYYVAPSDAYFDKTTNQVVEGTNGYGFQLEDARLALSQASYGKTVEIPLAEIVPNTTAQELSSMLLCDTLSTYTAVSDSNKDRNTNLRLACEAINGLILYPGDVFSYNDALGERTAARGYRPGPSYSGNKTVMTYGGGICQVSSALYYCALKAELQIVLRKNHGFMPEYMPVGLDATVSWGSIDFRFKNTLDYPVKIEATADGGETTVSIIGTELRDYRVELESDILSKIEYQITYETMSPDNPNGYKDGDYITEPYNGYTVKTYLSKYAVGSNEPISRDLIEKSVYRKRDGVICKIEQVEPSESAPEVRQ